MSRFLKVRNKEGNNQYNKAYMDGRTNERTHLNSVCMRATTTKTKLKTDTILLFSKMNGIQSCVWSCRIFCPWAWHRKILSFAHTYLQSQIFEKKNTKQKKTSFCELITTFFCSHSCKFHLIWFASKSSHYWLYSKAYVKYILTLLLIVQEKHRLKKKRRRNVTVSFVFKEMCWN